MRKISNEKAISVDCEWDVSINTHRSKLAALAVHSEVRQPKAAAAELDRKNLLQRMAATVINTFREGAVADRTILSGISLYPDYQKHYGPATQSTGSTLQVAPVNQPERDQQPYDQDLERNVTDIAAFRKQSDVHHVEPQNSVDGATIHNIAQHLS